MAPVRPLHTLFPLPPCLAACVCRLPMGCCISSPNGYRVGPCRCPPSPLTTHTQHHCTTVDLLVHACAALAHHVNTLVCRLTYGTCRSLIKKWVALLGAHSSTACYWSLYPLISPCSISLPCRWPLHTYIPPLIGSVVQSLIEKFGLISESVMREYTRQILSGTFPCKCVLVCVCACVCVCVCGCVLLCLCGALLARSSAGLTLVSNHTSLHG
jgi:hypothetical protein